MSPSCLFPLARRVSFFFVAGILSAGVAVAQSTASPSSSNTTSAPTVNWSSSLDSAPPAEFASLRPAAALPSAPAPSSAGAGQYNSGGSNGLRSHFAFQAGFGFNAPKSDSIGWGWNLNIGGGLNFNPHFATLLEYQFIRTGLSDKLIAEAGSQGGYAHIWSFTLDPIVDFFPNATSDFYVTGGGGFFRKVTSFTNPQTAYYCDYFYGCFPTTVNQVVDHFSSNQGGWSVGGGYVHRFGGIYGTSKMKFFAEARYLDVLTPAVIGTDPNTGQVVTSVPADTKLIPVTFGFRW